MSATAAQDTSTAEGSEKGIVCVIDLGEHSRQRVRRLRRGEGRLMDKVEDAVASLQESGVLAAGPRLSWSSFVRNRACRACSIATMMTTTTMTMTTIDWAFSRGSVLVRWVAG